MREFFAALQTRIESEMASAVAEAFPELGDAERQCQVRRMLDEMSADDVRAVLGL